MCSELFRIPYEWGGVPIFGVGVLLAIWAVVTAAMIIGIVRRQAWTADTLISLLVLLLVGAVILFLPRVFPDGLPIRGYGVMLLVGIITGVGMAMYRARQGRLDPEVILSLAIWLVIFGIIGARLFYVVEYWHEKFAHLGPRAMFFEVLNIPQGGLVIYGGFLGAAVGFMIFVRKHGLPLLAMADLIAPSMAIGLAIGRIGCFLNGCCYGGVTDWPWAVTFPQYNSAYDTKLGFSPPYGDQAAHGEMHGFRLDARDQRIVVTRVDAGSRAAAAGLRDGDVITTINGEPISWPAQAEILVLNDFVSQRPLRLTLKSGKSIEVAAAPIPERSRPVHPTQIYSAIDAGLLGWLLWAWYPFRRRDGELIALLLTIHPVTRFLLEIIRTDEPSVFGTGLSISQNISILLLVVGVGIWWYLSRKPAGVVWPLVAEGANPKKVVSPKVSASTKMQPREKPARRA
jgi:phosphatidylglycerol:prolipoprotein diacylglycerol transferase